MKLQIIHSESRDLDFIFSLFDSAIHYQKKKGYELWPQFSRELIEKEIGEGRHWKITEGDSILCIFSVLYNDPVIWKEKDNEPSVYLHRIAVNPLFKGKGIMLLIKDWAIAHAKQQNRKYVRMDTWGRNENLRNYYISCGFTYTGQQYLAETNGLPAHYGGSELSLFEIKV
ncbi:MAG: family acetyltransferase [Bacteroidetes bacterium]|jgi:GNAT superfamily N-acetyltransferase|nr:family acetyltransferase [Bacteroidota bacterium]